MKFYVQKARNIN